MNQLKDILSQLIQFQSVTPDDAGCQKYMINFFQTLGFHCQQFDKGCVSNFFACYGDSGPLFVFAGHTDVVPVGERDKWHHDPFLLTEKDNYYYGRGVADMKGSLASMMLMAKRFIEKNSHFIGRLGFLITSAEEGEDYEFGTPYIMDCLARENIDIDYCLVGEPSSTKVCGDVIKIGRRGSLNCKVCIHGKQGHVAYPHLAENPIHGVAQALNKLVNIQWDEGNQHFPPTTLQITHVHSGGEATNIIPGKLIMQFNFRFSTEQDEKKLQAEVEALFQSNGLNADFEWTLSGRPFLTATGNLLKNTISAIEEVCDFTPELSTSGGTSDGRFIAPYGVEVIELGPVNATIHQINERVAIADLETLTEIYYLLCEKTLITKN